jgi:hypothetical protein
VCVETNEKKEETISSPLSLAGRERIGNSDNEE